MMLMYVVCVKFVNETLYTDTEFQLRLHLLYEEANKRLTQRRRHYSTQLFCEQQQRSLFPLLLVSGFIAFRTSVRDTYGIFRRGAWNLLIVNLRSVLNFWKFSKYYLAFQINLHDPFQILDKIISCSQLCDCSPSDDLFLWQNKQHFWLWC